MRSFAIASGAVLALAGISVTIAASGQDPRAPAEDAGAAVPEPIDAGSPPGDAEPAQDASDAEPEPEPDAAAPAPASIPVPPVSQVGFAFAIHGAYGFPVGLAKDSSLSEVVGGMIPIGIELGYFLTPHLFLGAGINYGFGVNVGSGNSACSDPNISGCSATEIRFGALARWQFRPMEKIDPWVSAGLGYDIINLKATDTSGATVLAGSEHGFDILDVQVGADYKAAPTFGAGPFAEMAFGQYNSSTSTVKFHAWISFGLRLRGGI